MNAGITIGLLSHALACAGFAALALMLTLSRRGDGNRLAVAAAAALTAVWAGVAALAHAGGGPAAEAARQLEMLRSLAWIGVLLFLMRGGLPMADGAASSRGPLSLRGAALALAIIAGAQLGLEAAGDVAARVQLRDQPLFATLLVASRLLVAISGLVLAHNLYTNSREQLHLAPRLLCVGVGVVFAYDLNLHTLHFLLGVPSADLRAVRGAVLALAAPLVWLAFRNDQLARLRLSRQVAFQSASVMAIGLYLIAMAVLAYGLRLTGGDWGRLLQIVFLAVAMIGGALLALSPRVRAELRETVLRNFYRYRYDYRQEWVRFLATLEGGGSAGLQPLRERFISAVARVIDSPGGLLLEAADGGFEPAARWNWPAGDAARLPGDAPLAVALARHGRALPLAAAAADSAPAPPGWAPADCAVAVPLLRGDRPAGVLLLRRPLTDRALDWEDEELLATLGRQGASYLAEAASLAQLEEARAFDDFNRRFAFIMHDVKNLVSQVGLVARNAERHADNPAFRADMVATLNASVTKMNDLLALMGAAAKGEPAKGEADIARIATTVVAAKRRGHAALALEGADHPLPLPGDAGRLEAMLTHLVQNAIDASPPDAPIAVRLVGRRGEVRVEVADRGHGMTRAFIRDELFKPFRSTKAHGFGIGAFEAREIARQHGGRLEVESAPGEGSRFTLTLPAERRAARRIAA